MSDTITEILIFKVAFYKQSSQLTLNFYSDNIMHLDKRKNIWYWANNLSDTL